jgi:hypothetical protein
MNRFVETRNLRTTISVHTEPPGVVLRVRGTLDDRGAQLLSEVARAALVTVKRARRIHIDLRRAENVRGLPRIIHRLARAGAEVTPPATREPVPTSEQHAWSSP